MFLSLLPGVRELRTPLATGYLWALCIWLVLTKNGWSIPSQRPAQGLEQHAWDLIEILGPAAAIAALSFAAYLIGSFLEIGTGNLVVRTLGHHVGYFSPGIHYERTSEAAKDRTALDPALVNTAKRQVNQSFSQAAVRGLTRKMINDSITANLLSPVMILALSEVLDEIPQLASRLLISNAELHGKYDRLLAEASFRVNIAMPLAALGVIAILDSGVPANLQILLASGVISVGLMLGRQGSIRAVMARDVIAQAIIIGAIPFESSFTTDKEKSENIERRIRVREPSASIPPELESLVAIIRRLSNRTMNR